MLHRNGEISGGRFFFFNDTATTEIYTLSLHDALPISENWACWLRINSAFLSHSSLFIASVLSREGVSQFGRSEEHTSELQSRQYLVCRLLLEKKKNTIASLDGDMNKLVLS